TISPMLVSDAADTRRQGRLDDRRDLRPHARAREETLMGSLYRRTRSTHIWCKYYVDGRPVRESTGTETMTEARRFLKLREGAVATGQPILRRADRVRYDELAQDLRATYQAARRHLAPDLRVAVATAHELGWRMQSEVLVLERRQVDLAAGAIRLDPGTTKNDEGRVAYLSAALRAEVAAQIERVRAVERKTGRIIPHLFPYLTGKARLGQRRRDFRKAWNAACRAAGVPGMLRHDLRRTAVRDMVNLGVPERVAMAVTGHKTRAVFDRYHIVSPADLREVARKRDAAGAGHILGHTRGAGVETRRVTS